MSDLSCKIIIYCPVGGVSDLSCKRIVYCPVGGVSDDEESLAAKKTKQMIARTYGKRNRRKSKLKPTVYGTVWTNEEDVEEERSAQASILSQWMVCHSVNPFPTAYNLVIVQLNNTQCFHIFDVHVDC